MIFNLIPQPYKALLPIVGIIAVLSSTFYAGCTYGTSKTEKSYASEQVKAEKENAAKSAKSSKSSQDIVVREVDKIIEVEKKVYVYRDRIKEVTPPDFTCTIPVSLISLYAESVESANGVSRAPNNIDEGSR